MRRYREVKVRMPSEISRADGLAYALWLPERPRGGVVLLHGAGSAKENHYDFARLAADGGLAALAFDQRGHGESDGPMDDRAIADIVAMAALLRSHLAPDGAGVALRGSSMGGYFALVAAPAVDACAVVAICPAGAAGLRRGLARGTYGFAADTARLGALLADHSEREAAAGLEAPVLLLHAEGDEVVPVEQSRALATVLRHPASRLIAVPGGHHRSIQHDEELQAISLRFLLAAMADPSAGGARGVSPA